jgi:hypothetical protein
MKPERGAKAGSTRPSTPAASSIILAMLPSAFSSEPESVGA